jgi:hypothetical protein
MKSTAQYNNTIKCAISTLKEFLEYSIENSLEKSRKPGIVETKRKDQYFSKIFCCQLLTKTLSVIREKQET